ncbi:MAG: hypothetical protein M3P34_11215, partial [Actinomycetota bacterium]|nr:hypothetical protein [Actinomycetota bacterium]
PVADSTQVLGVPPAGAGIRSHRRLVPSGFLGDRRRMAIAAVLGAAAVLLLLGVVAGAGFGTSDPKDGVAADLREVAAELGTADGPASAEAERRLLALADAVERGGGAPEANAFLTQLAAWRDANQLTAAAIERMRIVVSRVPGVDPNAFAAPTTVPPVTEAPPPPPEAEEPPEDDARGKGKGKGRKGKGGGGDD